MSLCARCGHNSVWHRYYPDSYPIPLGGKAPRTCAETGCGCTLTRMDPEFIAHTDERGFPLPGHAAYRGDDGDAA